MLQFDIVALFCIAVVNPARVRYLCAVNLVYGVYLAFFGLLAACKSVAGSIHP